MRTEQDLQRALRTFEADNAPDTTAVRARLDSALAGRSTAPRGADVAVVAPNHWKQRAVGAMAAAACIGAVFVGGKVIESDRGAPADGPSVSVAPTSPATTASPTRTVATPRSETSVDRPQLLGLPGTRHVTDFEGTGTSKVALPGYVVPSHFVATVTVTCKGGSLRTIGDSTEKLGDAETVFPAKHSDACGSGTSISPRSRWVRLAFRGKAAWRMSFDLEPDLRTNALVSRSEPGGLTTSIAHGRGTRTITLPKLQYFGSGTAAIVQLRCSGSGVTFSTTDPRISAFYTHTCFPGFTYQFQVDGKAITAKALTVHASASTTWQLGV